mmetsp:Transcript_41086/g.113183  ORF Transcript_41086/g.113183 Transcript_41086/m.113183 type:complete len:439 (+) Transcript_41086:37-1353(+)
MGEGAWARTLAGRGDGGSTTWLGKSVACCSVILTVLVATCTVLSVAKGAAFSQFVQSVVVEGPTETAEQTPQWTRVPEETTPTIPRTIATRPHAFAAEPSDPLASVGAAVGHHAPTPRIMEVLPLVSVTSDRRSKKHSKTTSHAKNLPAMYLQRPEDPGSIPAEHGSSTHAGVTVVLMGFRNPGTLLQSACNHAMMIELVAAVLIVWNSLDAVSTQDAPCAQQQYSRAVHVIPSRYNTLLNRYMVYRNVTTDAVLLLDDDIEMMDASSLQRMYTTWATHQSQVVGLFSRCVIGSQPGSFEYSHRLGEYPCCGRYHLTTGRANMVHRSYLQLFMASQPQEILEHIFAQKPTCEDIALHFLVSNRTGLPPIKLTGLTNDLTHNLSASGMHGTRSGWRRRRSECLNMFTRLYGRFPLKTNIREDSVLGPGCKLPARGEQLT